MLIEREIPVDYEEVIDTFSVNRKNNRIFLHYVVLLFQIEDAEFSTCQLTHFVQHCVDSTIHKQSNSIDVSTIFILHYS